MLADIAIGTVIFGYAGWSLFRYVKRSKEGKCVACSQKKSCQAKCDI